jgi:hypothetical protein
LQCAVRAHCVHRTFFVQLAAVVRPLPLIPTRRFSSRSLLRAL